MGRHDTRLLTSHIDHVKGPNMMTDQPHRQSGLVLDWADPDRLTRFWAAALDYTNVGSASLYVTLSPRHRDRPKLLPQKVTEPKTTKNRMQLDIDASDIDAEAERLTLLRARRLTDNSAHEHGTTWILTADPEGNEFCVCDGAKPATGNQDINL